LPFCSLGLASPPVVSALSLHVALPIFGALIACPRGDLNPAEGFGDLLIRRLTCGNATCSYDQLPPVSEPCVSKMCPRNAGPEATRRGASGRRRPLPPTVRPRARGRASGRGARRMPRPASTATWVLNHCSCLVRHHHGGLPTEPRPQLTIASRADAAAPVQSSVFGRWPPNGEC